MSCQLRRSEQPSACPTSAAMLAAEVKALLDAGRRDEAADRFGALVVLWQRRAVRLAVHCLGNAADADDAVQDAFVKLYAHMTTYRADLSFDAWFTRIVVNACHDRARVRSRAHRWLVSLTAASGDVPPDARPSHEPSAEHRMVVANGVDAARGGGAPASVPTAPGVPAVPPGRTAPATGGRNIGNESSDGSRPPLPRAARFASRPGVPGVNLPGRHLDDATLSAVALDPGGPAGSVAAHLADLRAMPCPRCGGCPVAQPFREMAFRRRGSPVLSGGSRAAAPDDRGAHRSPRRAGSSPRISRACCRRRAHSAGAAMAGRFRGGRTGDRGRVRTVVGYASRPA